MSRNLTPDEMRKLVLDYMATEGYIPIKRRQLANILGIPEEQYEELKMLLRQMLSDGHLAKVGGASRYELASRSKRLIGKLTVRGTNYGFVNLGPEKGIVEIKRGNFGSAMHGDTVEVEVISQSKPGIPPLGRVESIVSAGGRRAVGTVVKGMRGPYFVPIRGGVFPEAEFTKAITEELPIGDLVTVEYVRDKQLGYKASVVERLGNSRHYASTLDAVLAAFEISADFPTEAVEQAETASAAPLDLGGRKDYRSLPTLTIDPTDAKDFDDALSLERIPQGWRLYVHIADVSAAVPRGSDLDIEARRRGTSVYLPGFVIPMLPHQLSNVRCCLSPNEDRLAKTAVIEFSEEGRRLGYHIERSVIHSRKRLDYAQVLAFLRGTSESLGDTISDDLIRNLNSLAVKLRAKRVEAGSINLDMPEMKLTLDAGGNPISLTPEFGDESHYLVEECMLAANCAVAELLLHEKIGGIYRVHDDPDPSSLEALRALLGSFGLSASEEINRAELTKILNRVSGETFARIVNLAILRTMKIAVYRDECTGHYALAFEKYLHFTSPIRRYPDLYVHQQLDIEYFDCSPRVPEKIARADIAIACSDTERNADECERNVVQLKTLEYLARFKGRDFDAVVMALKEFGAVAELTEFLVDGLLHVKDLGDEYFTLGRNGVSLRGQYGTEFRPGMPIRVRLLDVDLPRRRLELRFSGFITADKKPMPLPTSRVTPKRGSKQRGRDSRAGKSRRANRGGRRR